VVAVGLTLSEPLAEVDVNVPGVMAMLVAPLVAQLSVLLEPELIAVELAVKELIVGSLPALTATVCVDVTEPAALVAVSVYVVVAVGLTLVEPLPEVDVNVPGVMAMLVAPLVDQLRVLLEPEFVFSGTAAFMLPGEAANELIVGIEPFPGEAIGEIDELQPASKAQANRMRKYALRFSLKDLISEDLDLLMQEELVEPIKVTLRF
jgi:hypothetical protein